MGHGSWGVNCGLWVKIGGLGCGLEVKVGGLGGWGGVLGGFGRGENGSKMPKFYLVYIHYKLTLYT